MLEIDELSVHLRQWREAVSARRGITADDVDELEDHLLAEYQDLRGRGLSADEAFLVANHRLGSLSDVASEYLNAHPERAWQQLPAAAPATSWHLPVALGLGLVAGVLVRLPLEVSQVFAESFYLRGASLTVLAFLGVYLVVTASSKDRLGLGILAGMFGVGAVAAAVYPGDWTTQTLSLTAIHLPVLLLILTGICYLGRRWRSLEAWMDWVRYLGEAFIYYVLIALGGGVVVGLLVGIFTAVGIDLESVASWIIPVPAVGAVLVCAWLVERKKSAMENMAPVLTAVFTPVLTVALLSFLVVVAFTGSPVNLDRSVLIVFDVLLIVVAAIVLFTVSARPPESGPRALDWMQLVLIISGIAVDLLLLWALSGRLWEFGVSPNKLAALVVNLLLLVHLIGSAVHYIGVLRSKPSLRLERWQCLALPAFATWAAIVAFAFPPLFAFQ
ncbi:permease prefix domain 1-containing protein [Tessaracoccus caeni]|uniref:permease prefix domain 1-containing protein n=1 Tax=Tessaracoccus caeni TaxID=3031239 RepID=UPI0023DB3407|nr:permease prefix domain 1-containing protein [Tessaracoccus caeni]MDF1490109.1 permease prefix domain 1-containing protein [Tessaracoccus caeni]